MFPFFFIPGDAVGGAELCACVLRAQKKRPQAEPRLGPTESYSAMVTQRFPLYVETGILGLLGARTLLGAPGLTSRSKKLLGALLLANGKPGGL